MVNKMNLVQKRFDLEDKLIRYIDKLIDKNMEESSLSNDKLELVIKYLKS